VREYRRVVGSADEVAGVWRRADAGGELGGGGGGGGGAGGGEIKWHSRYSSALCLGRERKIFLKIKRRGVALPFWLVVAREGWVFRV
jgi:hypothetical protein